MIILYTPISNVLELEGHFCWINRNSFLEGKRGLKIPDVYDNTLQKSTCTTEKEETANSTQNFQCKCHCFADAISASAQEIFADQFRSSLSKPLKLFWALKTHSKRLLDLDFVNASSSRYIHLSSIPVMERISYTYIYIYWYWQC